MIAIAILTAGILGVALRWGLNLWWAGAALPFATLIVNSVGGFLMGLLQSQSAFSDNTKMVLGVGFLGAFTTFSAFSWETLKLVQQGQAGWAFANLFANNALAIGLCALGYYWGRILQ